MLTDAIGISIEKLEKSIRQLDLSSCKKITNAIGLSLGKLKNSQELNLSDSKVNHKIRFLLRDLKNTHLLIS